MLSVDLYFKKRILEEGGGEKIFIFFIMEGTELLIRAEAAVW
jgi:hypothetical protein